jgi:Ice-binding-like
MSSIRVVPSSIGPAGHPRRFVPRRAGLAILAAGALALFPAVGAAAATAPVGLASASSFSVLAGTGITNTGPTTISGDVGTFPTPAETGFGSVTLGGADHAGDTVTQQAKTDLVTAYDQAAGSGPAVSVPTELGGRTLTPGVYNATTLGITGTLTLDAQGDPGAVFVFQTASTLITAGSSNVIVANGATACNVFWQVGSSATLGTTSHLIGNVLALTSITATTGATIEGRLLARNGAVTLDTNTITSVGCAASPTGTPTGTGGTPTGTDGSPTGTDGSTTGAPGGSAFGTDGATPPSLAFTGSSLRLPLIGGATIVLGLALVGLGNQRRRRVTW